MLNWLRRRLINRRRAIFTYWNGQRLVSNDPMRIFRSLLTHPKFDWNQHPQLIDDYGRERESHAEREIVLDAIRDVFHVTAYDPDTGKGLTEEETLSLLWSFTHYCNSKKKSGNPSPTPPRSSEPMPSSEPDLGDEFPTMPCSDCG